jgi:hypothetical protein
MTKPAKSTAKLYTRYPLSSVLLYNGVTVLHFILGGVGIILGYHSWLGYLLGFAYMAFAFAEMYLIMPVEVCPNCVYYRLEGSLCISGMNVVSRKLVRTSGDPKHFPDRAKGTFCPNNLYIASLVAPIVLIIPALLIKFSWLALILMLVLIGLLAFRFFYVFTRVACVHCRAKTICPNAKSMGLGT